MSERLLADTSGLLAAIDASEARHQECARVFRALRKPLLTSEAVLAELFYLAGGKGRDPAWTLLRSGAVKLAEIGNAELPRLDALMARYADRPMDFADATLVHLAEREGLSTIFTLDNNDFETYRIGGRKRFRVVPGR